MSSLVVGYIGVCVFLTLGVYFAQVKRQDVAIAGMTISLWFFAFFLFIAMGVFGF